ncbi:MAG: hypothetical protein ACK5AY_13645, partial [Bacteroidota bacterium]
MSLKTQEFNLNSFYPEFYKRIGSALIDFLLVTFSRTILLFIFIYLTVSSSENFPINLNGIFQSKLIIIIYLFTE